MREDLLNIYSETAFMVPDMGIVIFVGETNPNLDALLRPTTWAFITACNPYSEQLSDVQNTVLNDLLENDLAEYNVYPALGRREDWNEDSFLVLGISKEEATRLAIKYKQNAFVFGKFEEKAELVWTNNQI